MKKFLLWLWCREEFYYDDLEIFFKGVVIGGAVMTAFCMVIFRIFCKG